VDEGTHVGLNEKPFWFAGALVVYHMGQNYTRMDLHSPDAVEPAKKTVSNIAERLRAEGGGLISIFYHPCEWVHQEFWDGVNFRRGANPPRELWKAPPQRSAEETDAAFRRFAEYIDHIRGLPGIRWVTAGDLPSLYPDYSHTQGASEQDLTEFSQRLVSSGATNLDLQVLGNRAYSLADQFEVLTWAVSQLIEQKSLKFPHPTTGILGPDADPPGSREEAHLAWPAFRDTTLDVLGFIKTQQRVPARVFIGPDAVAPADFLYALASAYLYHSKHGKLPMEEGVSLGRSLSLKPARQVAQDTPELFGGWIIHKEGFRAPKILEQARLQTWTLKPAIRKGTVD
jgi:hypothetical protein